MINNRYLKPKITITPNYLQACIYIVLAFLFVPLLNQTIIPFIGGIFYFAILLFTTFVCVMRLKQSTLDLPQVLSFFIWVTCFLLTDFFIIKGNPTAFDILGLNVSVSSAALIQLVCFYTIYLYLNSTMDTRLMSNVGTFVLGSLVISAVLGWNALIGDPMATRELATGQLTTNVFSAGYGIVNSIVMIFPVVIGMIFQRSIKTKLRYIIAAVILILFVIKTTLFTSLMCLILGTTVFIIMQVKRVFRYLIIGALAVYLILSFNVKPVVYVMNSFADFIGDYELQQRITAVADEMMYGKSSSSTMDRLELYQKSINGFLEAPIFGKHIIDPTWKSSGHSEFLDMLGGFGLLGTLPLFMFLYYLFKKFFIAAKNPIQKGMIAGSVAVFIFFSFVNPWMTNPSIFVSILFACNYSIINKKRIAHD